jgi:N-acetylmuramoyl-L-alanine amidase
MASLSRKSIPSPNYSSRGGSKVRLIILHTAEGARTIEELGNYFASSSSNVSSHTGADDKKGTIGEYVKRGNKAWTAGNANPVAVQIELCAFAKWSTAEWNKHPNMLENCARWIAEEAAYFGIPITRLSPAQSQNGRGVCQHADVAGWTGSSHWDCGGGFPMDKVLEMARGGGEEEMGYPEWFWDWNHWYLNTDRNQKDRPKNAPDDIPEWAWDGQEELLRIADKYGMTKGERDWIAWYLDGKKGERPNVYETIPDHWWDDQSFVAKR